MIEKTGSIQPRRTAGLEDAHEGVFLEWDESEDAGLWDTTTADGIPHADDRVISPIMGGS
jgi:hypothetical protein